LDNNLFFQEDNAPCHVGKKSLEYINQNFKNHLEFLPPNSPDLLPIEELWAIVQDKINNYSFETLEDMSKKLLWLWNRIPKTICRRLVDSFNKKIGLLGEKRGERVNKSEHCNNNSNYTWRNAQCDDIEFFIVYNEKVLEIMKKNKIN